jgi:hypothetical protein
MTPAAQAQRDDPDTFCAAGLEAIDLDEEESLYGPIDEMLAAALRHARRGRRVFPLWWPVWSAEGSPVQCACGDSRCHAIGKHPITEHGFKDATTERLQIRRWWEQWPRANIGIPTGAGTFDVLDVDPDKGGDVTLAALEHAHGPLPETPETLTGGGGRHLAFLASGLRNSAGTLGPGLDIRGDGGYIVAPPSVHASGRRYEVEVEHDLDEMPLALMPPWLLALALGTAGEGHGGVAAPVEGVIPQGRRNTTLTSLAGRVRRAGFEEAEIAGALLEVNRRRCHPPLDDQEVRGIAASVGRYAPGEAPPAADAASRETSPPSPEVYIESIAGFLAEEDRAVEMLFPMLLPAGVIMLIHGEPRARKSLLAFELAMAAATGTAPCGLSRFRPDAAISVLYVQEEDPRRLTRPRLGRLLRERCGDALPETLHVSIRRGVDLDAPAWVARLIDDCVRLRVKLLVLDAARRFSAKTDEGPAKVRELIVVLRAIVTRTGASIIIVHHDVKPPANGQDQRRRSQRASGGDWFAAAECPVHVEKLTECDSLAFPEDYKFSADPMPFRFTIRLDGELIAALQGEDVSVQSAARAGVKGKVLDWLRGKGPASKTTMKKAGLGRWGTIEAAVEDLLREGKLDATPGRTAGSSLFFVPERTVPRTGDGSTTETVHAL